jgi:hypothetical protein
MYPIYPSKHWVCKRAGDGNITEGMSMYKILYTCVQSYNNELSLIINVANSKMQIKINQIKCKSTKKFLK